MAEILTTQSDIDRIMQNMRGKFNGLNKRQQEFAIEEFKRTRAELFELLSEEAGEDGVISRRRTRRIIRELDEVERQMIAYGDKALTEIVEESTIFTTKELAKVTGVTISASQFDRINKHVIKYVINRFGDDNLVLSERVWGLSGEVRDELSTTIRRSILKGESINDMMPKIRDVYDTESWKIRRLARTESVTAHRAATSYNAQESGLVKWVRFHDGTCGRKDHHRHKCYELANADKYGKGAGIYKPTDTEIWMPHPNCTSYISYVLDERWL